MTPENPKPENAAHLAGLAVAPCSALSDADVLAYLKSLKPGERVIETGESGMKGVEGTVYISKTHHDICVRWELPNGDVLGTSATWGTRRLCDSPNKIIGQT